MMRILAFVFLTFPIALIAQKKVGINTVDPDHPFQVNVDSIWMDTIEDANIPPSVAILPGLAITPGSEKGAQRFVVGQTGHLSKLQFWFTLPTVTDELLIEVFRGAGPEGELIASKTELNIIIGTRVVELPQPWPTVTEGETLNVVMTPTSGASCKWKGGAYDLAEITAFHYTGTWDSITIDLAFTAFVTYSDTVEHAVLKVRDDRKLMINDYILPMTDGQDGEIMMTDGNGVVSWMMPPPEPPQTSYYPNVNICCQSWMTKNLDVRTYRNGDSIPHVTNDAEWDTLTTGAYCYFNNDSTNYAATYGKLYNWYAVNDPRGLAPDGWHIPSDFEWTTLVNCLGGANIAGGLLKETGTMHWWSPNTSATNVTNFTAVPGGLRLENGDFLNHFVHGLWWSSTEESTSDAWKRQAFYDQADLLRNSTHKRRGLSVRCIRD